MTADEWWQQAACLDVDPDVFFWDEGNRIANRMHNQWVVSHFCGCCPVRTECLTEALALEEDASRNYRHGIFGGLTPHQRAERRAPADYRLRRREMSHASTA